MKRFKSIFAGLLALLLVTAFAVDAFATQPTVTVTKVRETSRSVVYKFSFSTDIANVDSAFIYNENGSWFPLEGWFQSDSSFTIEVETTETTADSSHLTVLFQVTSAQSPSNSNDTWITAVSSTDFNGKLSAVFTINRKQYGHSTKGRIIMFENDTLKDASQTFSGYIIFPKK